LIHTVVIYLNRKCPRRCPYCNVWRIEEQTLSVPKWKNAFLNLREYLNSEFYLILNNEPLLLGNDLNFRFELTCSCDNPKVINDEIYLCRECGSTRLNTFASQMAGIKDPCKFYGKESEEFIQLKSKDIKTTSPTSPIDIINRLILPPEERQILIEMVSGHGNSTS